MVISREVSRFIIIRKNQSNKKKRNRYIIGAGVMSCHWIFGHFHIKLEQTVSQGGEKKYPSTWFLYVFPYNIYDKFYQKKTL